MKNQIHVLKQDALHVQEMTIRIMEATAQIKAKIKARQCQRREENKDCQESSLTEVWRAGTDLKLEYKDQSNSKTISTMTNKSSDKNIENL